LLRSRQSPPLVALGCLTATRDPPNAHVGALAVAEIHPAAPPIHRIGDVLAAERDLVVAAEELGLLEFEEPGVGALVRRLRDVGHRSVVERCGYVFHLFAHYTVSFVVATDDEARDGLAAVADAGRGGNRRPPSP